MSDKKQEVIAAVKSWFDDNIDDEMLVKMEMAGIIAQAFGFKSACLATLELEIEDVFGGGEDDEPMLLSAE